MNSSRRMFVQGLCACGGLTLMGCVATTDLHSKPGSETGDLLIEPPLGYRPPAGSDEAALWFEMDREEERLKRSQFLVRDPVLNTYVGGIVKKLAGPYAADMRVYVVRSPVMNASMAPNGVMIVHTGLLLHSDNEAQVAAVLGHEMGHYVRRHSLYGYRDRVNDIAPGMILAIGFSLVGVPLGPELVRRVQAASQSAYGRRQELEADRYGQQVMAAAGYQLEEAERLWQNTVDWEKAAPEAKDRDILSATHPESALRVTELAKRRPGYATTSAFVGRESHVEALRHARLWMVRDEIRGRMPATSLVIFDRMLKLDPADALAWFGKGETHRLRDAPGDSALAASAFDKTIALPDAPAIAWRSYGFLEQRRQNHAAAAAHFRAYLAREQDAEDRPLLEGFIRNGGRPA